jgi:hypothetical protein
LAKHKAQATYSFSKCHPFDIIITGDPSDQTI